MLSRDIASVLPVRTQVDGLTVSLSVGAAQPMARADTGSIDELQFRDGSGGNTEDWTQLLRVTSNFVSVSFAKYESFSSAFDRARALLALVMPTILRYVSVPTIGLQYVDEFYFDGPIDEFNPLSIFDERTDVLPSRLLTTKAAGELTTVF